MLGSFLSKKSSLPIRQSIAFSSLKRDHPLPVTQRLRLPVICNREEQFATLGALSEFCRVFLSAGHPNMCQWTI
ncbi:hypothetical protein C8J55DRAFT_528899 [Lentinula edodes]|uniref:Uncharacterized protein n=1 Tax=Lentinula lateritia TaxID=40482 RepID=A0A9W8ZRU2_9AGAR|nr:hypothetical protein C8J55DRAFT_528899 [Lentinula edodes]